MQKVTHGTTSEKILVSGLCSTKGWKASEAEFSFTPTTNLALTSDEGSMSLSKEGTIQGATIVPRSLFFIVEEQSSNRWGMSTGRVSVRSMRTSQEKPPWKDLPDLAGVVEKRFIFDVHLGSTIVPFRTLDPWRAALPLSSGQLLSTGKIEAHAQGLGNWWGQASHSSEANKTKASRLSLWEQLNYQNKLSRQLSAPAHSVVYSASGNTLVAARLDDPRQIVEHAL